MNEKIELINKYLDKYLEQKDNPQSVIYEAMRYSVFAGGKRLRPYLMLSVCEMCGGDMTEVMPFACAMEMIHTYSLIHDDLPAMDNDDLRRGKPTSHVKFGEANAILAGDALLTKAFETASSYSGKHADRALSAIALLARSAGTDGMIGGQIIDIASEGASLTVEELRGMHLLKTGAIIRSSCAIGAMLAGASVQELRAVDEFALNLGIAFQIQDDILDIIGNEELLGKRIGSDEADNKSTYPSLLGLEKSYELVEKYSEQAAAALKVFGERSHVLLELTKSLAKRSS